MLVGIDDHSDYPPEVVADLPRVGPDLGIDVERVAALEPDLVLSSLTVPGHEKVVESLDAAGLSHISLEPIRLDDVYTDILEIGKLLNALPKAQECVREMKRALHPVASSARKPSLLIQWWPKPVIAPGMLSWTEDLMLAAGLENPIGDRNVKSTPLTDEEVLTLDPDAIAISWCGVKHTKYRPDVIYRNPTWQKADFVTKRRVFTIPEAYLGRPSPRLVDGFVELKKIAEALSSKTGD